MPFRHGDADETERLLREFDIPFDRVDETGRVLPTADVGHAQGGPVLGGGGRVRHAGAVNPRDRPRLSPLAVIGEFLLVVGLVISGYIVWQPWHSAVVEGGRNRELAVDDTERWAQEPAPEPPEDPLVVPPVLKGPRDQAFGVLHVPAFGTDWVGRVAEGIDMIQVLNRSDKGIGHYDETQLPGVAGNFALAAHRSGPQITPFREVDRLRVGDPIFFENEQGWYTYRFRSSEYVSPSEVDVLSPFPRVTGVSAPEMVLTLTTCHPKLSGDSERLISYAIFESFQPRADGPPAELLQFKPELKG